MIATDLLTEAFSVNKRSLRRIAADIPIAIRSRIDADDILQESILAAIKSGGFRGQSIGEATVYLSTVVKRRLLNSIQRFETQKRTISVEFQADAIDGFEIGVRSDVAERLETTEELNRVIDAMAQLSPRQAEAIRLSAIEGLSNAEGAERMGVHPAAFGGLLKRGRESLRKYFDEFEQKSAPNRQNPSL